MKDLTERGLWDDDMKNKIIAYGGSIQVNYALTFVFKPLSIKQNHASKIRLKAVKLFVDKKQIKSY